MISFRSSDLITTLTYAFIMGNFCPCLYFIVIVNANKMTQMCTLFWILLFFMLYFPFENKALCNDSRFFLDYLFFIQCFSKFIIWVLVILLFWYFRYNFVQNLILSKFCMINMQIFYVNFYLKGNFLSFKTMVSSFFEF